MPISQKEQVAQSVCQYLGVDWERVRSRWKYRDLVNARMFITYILRNADQFKGKYTYAEIANLLNRKRGNGRPDHTVPVHYDQNMDFMVLHYEYMRVDLQNLLKQLNLSMTGIGLN